MEKIKSLADLKKKRESLQTSLQLPEHGENKPIQVKVAMATCGIASGAKQVMEVILNECSKRNLPVVVTQTGCMGYCYAEPTVEVTKPGMEPVVFGDVTPLKADELVAKYLVNNEMLDCVIPVNYETPENHVQGAKPTDPNKKQIRIALRNCGFINPEKIDD